MRSGGCEVTCDELRPHVPFVWRLENATHVVEQLRNRHALLSEHTLVRTHCCALVRATYSLSSVSSVSVSPFPFLFLFFLLFSAFSMPVSRYSNSYFARSGPSHIEDYRKFQIKQMF